MRIDKDIFSSVLCCFCLFFGIGGAIKCFIDGETTIAIALLLMAVIGIFVFPFKIKKK